MRCFRLDRTVCSRFNLIVRLPIFLLLANFIFPIALHAGAWTINARQGQLITTFSYFNTSRTYDNSGTVGRFPDNGSFRQININPYLEYGLTSRYTLVLNAQIPILDYGNSYGNMKSAGLGDLEIGIRRRLNALEAPLALSGQLTVMLPLYSASRNPAPGNHQEDIEARFMVGHGSTILKQHAFWDAQVAYRTRLGAPADQIRVDLTAGINLGSRLMAMGQLFNIHSMRNGQPLDAITNPNAQSDFDLHKYQLSLVLNATQMTRIQLGWNNTFSGRNTGCGQTLILALWKDF